MVVHRVEFTIEPFVEARPGLHVTAPIEELRTMGIDVTVGPFGSECTIEPSRSSTVVAVIVRAAFENGASHVNLDVTGDRES